MNPVVAPSKRQKIVHMKHAEWLLVRGSVYLGSFAPSPMRLPLLNADGVASWTDVCLPQALVTLFGELFVNATDNAFRDDTMRYIKVDFSADGVLTIANDGSVIAIEQREDRLMPPVLHELRRQHLATPRGRKAGFFE